MEQRHLADMIAQSCRRHADRVAMRYKTEDCWHAVTYRQVGEQIQRMAAALTALGVQAGDRVGIFSQNCAEWAIADFGILTLDAVTVPIYATNTAAQAEYIVRDAGIKVLFVGDGTQYTKINSLADKPRSPGPYHPLRRTGPAFCRWGPYPNLQRPADGLASFPG